MELIRRGYLNVSESREVFSWRANSCYMDTIFWVLFHAPNRFIDLKILFSRPSVNRLHDIATCANGEDDLNERVFIEFQAIFRQIALYFRRGEGNHRDCSIFRRLYKKWHNNDRCHILSSKIPFHLGDQNESQEFLQFILSLYGMNGVFSFGAVAQERIFYGVSRSPRALTHWNFIYDRRDRKQSLVWNIPYASLAHSEPNQRSLSDFLSHSQEVFNIEKEHKKCRYNSFRSVKTLVRFAPLLILSLERANPLSGKVLRRRVDIPYELTDEQQSRVRLSGIVCHDGEYANAGHYTAFADYGNNSWYYYDDLNLPLKYVGAWENVRTIRSIASSAILFFYTSVA